MPNRLVPLKDERLVSYTSDKVSNFWREQVIFDEMTMMFETKSCHSFQTHYPDSKPTILCSNSLILHV